MRGRTVKWVGEKGGCCDPLLYLEKYVCQNSKEPLDLFFYFFQGDVPVSVTILFYLRNFFIIFLTSLCTAATPLKKGYGEVVHRLPYQLMWQIQNNNLKMLKHSTPVNQVWSCGLKTIPRPRLFLSLLKSSCFFSRNVRVFCWETTSATRASSFSSAIPLHPPPLPLRGIEFWAECWQKK